MDALIYFGSEDYDEVVDQKFLTYTMANGCKAKTAFEKIGNTTKVTTVFDAERENSVELQKNGWQAIFNGWI